MPSAVTERFLRYVQIDTQSDHDSKTVPSTEKQKDLGRLLVSELRALGLQDAAMDEYGYVFATLPSTLPPDEARSAPVLGLLAHLDTSPDAPGANVRPVVHPPYEGGVIELPGDPSVRLDPAERPAMLDHLGHNFITSDGTTLLGSDDKAGVAVLMQLAADLMHDTSTPRPVVRLCFTIDEEIGRGVDHLDLARFGADVAYTIDGSGTDRVAFETFNAAEASLEIDGVAVHPGYARDVLVNAVRILADFIAALPAGEAPETTDGRYGYFHPHTIGPSDAARARVRVLLRDFSSDGLQRRKDYLEQVVASLRLKYPRARLRLQVEDNYRNMRAYIEQTDPRVIEMAFRAAEAMGLSLQTELVRGGTDGARLSELGLPTPNVFNGGHDYHSRFEWNTVQNLERSLAYVKTLVHTWGRHDAEPAASTGTPDVESV